MMNTSTSAYLFIRGNSSLNEAFQDKFCKSTLCSAPRFAINLDNLPATFVEQGIGVTADSSFVGPLASILLYNARFKISGGCVCLENDGTINVISLGQPPDGSFSSKVTSLIFLNAFWDTLSEPEMFRLNNLVNTIAASMFMNSSYGNWNNVQDIAPLDISLINKNVDDFISSAANAFIDGYYQVELTRATFDLVSVPSLGEGQQLALTTSKELFIVTVVLDVITTALLYTLV